MLTVIRKCPNSFSLWIIHFRYMRHDAVLGAQHNDHIDAVLTVCNNWQYFIDSISRVNCRHVSDIHQVLYFFNPLKPAAPNRLVNGDCIST